MLQVKEVKADPDTFDLDKIKVSKDGVSIYVYPQGDLNGPCALSEWYNIKLNAFSRRGVELSDNEKMQLADIISEARWRGVPDIVLEWHCTNCERRGLVTVPPQSDREKREEAILNDHYEKAVMNTHIVHCDTQCHDSKIRYQEDPKWLSLSQEKVGV